MAQSLAEDFADRARKLVDLNECALTLRIEGLRCLPCYQYTREPAIP